MYFNRRAFLKRASSCVGAASTLATLGSALSSFELMASEEEGYKAIVCVYLLGGMDNYDTVLPYDKASYDHYTRLRPSLMARYGGDRKRSKLLPLSPKNTDAHGGRSFALPSEMPNLARLFNAGQAAIIANVGPLLTATHAQTFEDESVPLPQRLFSHNDQQAAWFASSSEQSRYGWGGLFTDPFIDKVINQNPEFSTITAGGYDLFLTGKQATPFQVNPEGPQYIHALEDAEDNKILRRLLKSHLAASYPVLGGLAEQDIANSLTKSLASNKRFNQSISRFENIHSLFDEGDLNQQLKVVAQTIAARKQLGVKRQVFVVGIDGFDTHSDQANELPQLQAELDLGIANFYQALDKLELSSQVTLFTASEFGRTLSVNDDGTDHGWGGHQFVVGAAVKGKNIYGHIPKIGFDHALDAGHGRLIPTLSVEQMAAPIGRWFGLSQSELAKALPNLANFTDNLNFI